MFIRFILVTLLFKYFFKKEWNLSIFYSGLITFAIHLFSLFGNYYYYEEFPRIILIATIISGIHYWGGDKRNIEAWLANGYNNERDSEKALMQFAENTKHFYTYNYLDIPIGRGNAFIDGFNELDRNDYIDMDYFGYNPVRSEDLMELREYGTLITNKGIFAKYQEEVTVKDPDTNKKIVKYEVLSTYIPFAGLWSIEVNEEQDFAIFKLSNGSRETLHLSKYSLNKDILYEIKELIEDGITRNLLFEKEALQSSEGNIQSAESQIQDAYESLLKKNITGLGIYQGFLANQTVYDNQGTSAISQHMKDIQLNRMTTHTGHGEAAEYTNSVFDKFDPRYNVKDIGGGASNTEGAGQGVNAFDRVRTNSFTGETHHIQTKYYSDQTRLAREVANMDYPPNTTFEVPRGEKAAAEAAFKRQGLDYKIIEGKTSYLTSHLVTKAGNIQSITVDLVDGAIQSTTGASITFIIAYAQSRHMGLTREESIKNATSTGLITLGVGSILYAGSQQFAKTELAKNIAQNLTTRFGRNISVADIAGYAGVGITVAIVYGPSAVDALRGRISPQQLAKNITISTFGIGGALIGNAAGKFVGSQLGGVMGSVAGPAGSILGSMTGSYLSKTILDKYVEDDSVEIFEIYREEFIDYLYQVEINQEELDELITLTFTHKKFNSQLKNVYKFSRKSKGDDQEQSQRKYIREEILEPIYISILEKRELVSEEEIDVASNYSMFLLSEPNAQTL